MKCTQCKAEMEKVTVDIGYGIKVDSLHCEQCGFNVTEDQKLDRALADLRVQMSKEVKIVRVGTGLGVRIPNEMVKNYHLEAGEEILMKPEMDGIKLRVLSDR